MCGVFLFAVSLFSFWWVLLVFHFILSFGQLSLSAYTFEKLNCWSITKCITRMMRYYMFSSMLIMKDQNMWLSCLKGKPWRYQDRELRHCADLLWSWNGSEEIWRCGLELGPASRKHSYTYLVSVSLKTGFWRPGNYYLIEFWPRYQTWNLLNGCFCQALHSRALHIIGNCGSLVCVVGFWLVSQRKNKTQQQQENIVLSKFMKTIFLEEVG